jgi:catalase
MSTPNVPATTNNAGIPVGSDEHSPIIGPDGPILLHDHGAIEKTAQFNRERIPERVVHAKGSGAYGHVEVTSDVSRFTKAHLFQPGRRAQMPARFSTVAGEHLVGTNTPVSFVRDTINFQDFVRSQKRRHIEQAAFEPSSMVPGIWRSVDRQLDRQLGDPIAAAVTAG